MSDHIPTYHKLLVVSDTSMCQHKGVSYAFGPVVKELEELSCFESIVWMGFDTSALQRNNSFVKINNSNIKLNMLPPSGGTSVLSKLLIIFYYPLYFFRILKEVSSAKYIHVRAPSNPAVIVMLLSFLCPSKQFWFKYAGNWIGEASWFYKLQRLLLKYLGKNSKITVNGAWAKQPKNVIGFENPCLDQQDRILGQQICKTKQIDGKLNYCFVGGMNTNKGVDKIIDVLVEISKHDNFGTFHFVGGGPLLEDLKKRSQSVSHKIVFHGFLAKNEIHAIYQQCHCIVLPSKSEGFPKVIGEAMNFGCVPIVSDISCIGQYVKHQKNGFLIHPVNTTQLKQCFLNTLELTNSQFKNMLIKNYALAEKFTYAYYEQNIEQNIFVV